MKENDSKKMVCVVIWAREGLAGSENNTRLEEESVSNSKLLSTEQVSMYPIF